MKSISAYGDSPDFVKCRDIRIFSPLVTPRLTTETAPNRTDVRNSFVFYVSPQAPHGVGLSVLVVCERHYMPYVPLRVVTISSVFWLYDESLKFSIKKNLYFVFEQI